MKTLKTASLTACALAAALALGACQRNDDSQTAGQKVDSAMANAEQKVDSAVANAEQKAGEMKAEMKQESAEAKESVKGAVDAAGDKMKDAGITTAVNAELARDTELSALRINVDTAAGRVVLRGTAPTAASRERATTLASRVDGVVSVDNQLSVGKSG